MTNRGICRKRIDEVSEFRGADPAHLAFMRKILGMEDMRAAEGLALRLAQVGLDAGTSESELRAAAEFGCFGTDYSSL